MDNFVFYNPVKIIFGEGEIRQLSAEIQPYNCILLAYGGGSIKRNGVYEAVRRELAGKKVVELAGIMPNPRREKVDEGVALCRQEGVDFILAVGGGSTIDCCKAIAAAAFYEGDWWQHFFREKAACERALPLGSVLTLAGTGSEFNMGGVVSDWQNRLKTSYASPLLFPKFSILDPQVTYSLPREQMLAGAIDTLSHLFEQFFSTPEEDNVSDDLALSLMKSEIKNLNLALRDEQDHVARSNMMWISSLALNTLTSRGKRTDWMSHQLEHALSAFYDVTHGLGLAVVHPVYLATCVQAAPARFARFAEEVWGLSHEGRSDAELGLAGLARMRAYFREIGAPITLQELGIPEAAIPEIAAKTLRFPTAYSDLDTAGIERILRFCLSDELPELA